MTRPIGRKVGTNMPTRDLYLERMGDSLWLGVRESGVTILGVSLNADQAQALDEAVTELRPKPKTHFQQIADLPIGTVFRRPGINQYGNPRGRAIKVSQAEYYSVEKSRLYYTGSLNGVHTETTPIIVIPR